MSKVATIIDGAGYDAHTQYIACTEIWIRVLGLFTFTTAFFQATVVGRMFFFVMMLVFVFAFQQSYMLAVIGSVDLLGAIWTFYAKK